MKLLNGGLQVPVEPNYTATLRYNVRLDIQFKTFKIPHFALQPNLKKTTAKHLNFFSFTAPSRARKLSPNASSTSTRMSTEAN